MTESLSVTPDDGTKSNGLDLGAEEELHVVDLVTRELVPRAQDILDQLNPEHFSAELHRSVVETNTPVAATLDGLRDAIVGRRRTAIQVAESLGLGLVAAGTVPLVDLESLPVTPTSRYRRMLDDYQLLAREQLICGAQVHVGVPDRDEAVAVSQRVASALPTLLALSTSSPYWMGEDSGYASVRSLVWLRWPTAGDPGRLNSAADYDELVEDLLASGTITDPKMVYFDVRPSAHLPTVELRVTDSSPDVDTVVLLAGLFRGLVLRAQQEYRAERPFTPTRPPLHRAAMWRAARSGLEGDLLDLPHSPQPVPAAVAVERLVGDLRPQLEELGDWEQVFDLSVRALSRGSSAARQRRAMSRRGRISDVVDLVVADTRGGATGIGPEGQSVPGGLFPYARTGDEAFPGGDVTEAYAGILNVLTALGSAGLRRREDARDDEQRQRGITFSVAGEAATRLFPFDLVPRVVPASDWAGLRVGLVQRVRALDLFIQDVYGDRNVVGDGIMPEWVIDGSPELRPSGALVAHAGVRAQVAGVDLVRDADGQWCVLEDNLRVPSGIAYAMQNRRLTEAVLPELPEPENLISVERTPQMLLRTLVESARPAAGDTPRVVVLSQGPDDSAWFEHRMLADEMGVPVVRSTELFVDGDRVFRLRDGKRYPVDVIYLRMGEDSLVHSPGADGMPLGPSLITALHADTVVLANALGNGIGDDKAVYAYVPKLIEYYLGEKPLLNDVTTYLCGIPEQRAEVLDRLDQLVCKPVDGYGGDRIVIGPHATEEELSAVRRQIRTAPHRWVAQEVVQLSTHPVFDGHQLAARHVDLRAFIFTGAESVVAPAALTRVAPAGSMIVNSSRGGGSKDTWLLG
ncbi:carboxylate--amine ligase/circularly permuted type 2 ATP-grasp protein [Actinoplanes sp. LDG1-06]|uniref:Putative glutamate--cysteine ligase 2 n=1 Tax=Paractinoplanes ovalisporus TaxID=2810368 RepID=A0ABS2ASS4_9ACTN|nr:carboxylate--amine ligase/circularly permuted type 2 ATP-grasp protein [Actinoplanes ovalisporus]MBM2622871.1 carboxylate--amine ligase/circularly permuted type 2 ATP-grasp protein [Actinoplanes ovalisporus]